MSGAIGLGVSNGVGGFMAEHTVEQKRLRKIETAMTFEVGALEGTLPHDHIQRKLAYDTVTHGGCSFGGALVPIFPFFFGLDPWLATQLAVAISLAVLFALGVYSGVMTKENLMWSGMKMTAVGILVAVFIWAVEFSGII
jgi:predicted membrane protein (TIGR00267 family)